jgi:hypothetical protein
MTPVRSPSRLDPGALLAQARHDARGMAGSLVAAAAARLESGALRNAISADRNQVAPVLAVLQGRGRAFADRLAVHLEAAMAGDEACARPATRRPEVLSLISEDSIDEDIEIARVVQAVDSQAEWELGQLASLVSSLTGVSGISIDTYPLRPAVIGRAIRSTCLEFDLDKPARLRLMREVGAAAAAPLRVVYAAHVDWLLQHGVEPAQYVIRTAADGTTRSPGMPPTGPAPGPVGPRAAPAAFTGSAGAALGRLVMQARQASEAGRAASSEGAGGDLALRLLDEPVMAGTAPGLDSATAVAVMERLLALLSAQVGASQDLQRLIARLETPARQLAARDPALWHSPDHPWWQLIERVVAAASVDPAGSSEAEFMATSLEGAVDALVNTEPSRGTADADACRRAVANVDFVVTGLLEECGQRIAPEVDRLEAELDCDRLETEYREQIIQQLRIAPVPQALRPFLLGPWPRVLACAALAHGRDGEALARAAQFVDLVLDHCSRFVAQPPEPGLVDYLLLRAGRGLMDAGHSKDRIQAELRDLRVLLRAPGAAGVSHGPDHAPPPSAPAPAPVPPESQVLGLHDALPTVPIDMDGRDDGPSSLDRRAWLDSLAAGDYCRLFLLGRWMTAQVRWRSDNGTMFVFSSRHAGRLHSLSRRALDKLRAAGLAATLRRGQMLAQAMDTLTEELAHR